ncbi:Tll0287-like domain-containing protein [Cognaticolwellia mytili]|uniref:Tll0287-like domain-containing protein n=1 Tax=Cognaticolwellia mytili TaxID=1888913 RepID=UPI000A177556|nr:DUF3365 domain-containing protein [Cognaticolwellia mytili]
MFYITKAITFIFLVSWSLSTFAKGETLIELSQQEDKILSNIGDKAASKVSKTLMATMLADIKSLGLVGAAQGWSKSVNIINQTAESFNLGMKIKRPTYQYRNPINRPDDIDKVALNFFLSDASENEKYFSRKVEGEEGYRYFYYQPMYVKKKCLLCHSEDMNEELKAVIDKKYPNDHSGALELAQLRALIRIELPESAIK